MVLKWGLEKKNEADYSPSKHNMYSKSSVILYSSSCVNIINVVFFLFLFKK